MLVGRTILNAYYDILKSFTNVSILSMVLSVYFKFFGPIECGFILIFIFLNEKKNIISCETL